VNGQGPGATSIAALRYHARPPSANDHELLNDFAGALALVGAATFMFGHLNMIGLSPPTPKISTSAATHDSAGLCISALRATILNLPLRAWHCRCGDGVDAARHQPPGDGIEVRWGHSRRIAASQACAAAAPNPRLIANVSAAMPVTFQPSANAATSSSSRTRRGPQSPGWRSLKHIR
jgi:hypothetical protein